MGLRMTSNRLCVAVFALLFLILPSATFAGDATYEKLFSKKGATGEELAHAFFDLLSKTGGPAGAVGTTAEQDAASKRLIKPYLDPAFQLQRSSGQHYIAETYLPADVDDFEIGEVRETRPAEDVVVVRYFVGASQTLPDAALVMSKDKAARLSVFHWSISDARWKILSHANFNTPIAAFCNQKPIVDNGLESPASSEDQTLGEGLMRNFYDLLVNGNAELILNPLFQYQSAIGVGFTTLSERKTKTKFSETQFDHAVVTRNKRLLIVSLYNTTKERVLMGQYHLRAGKSASMATFLQGSDGVWAMIALASFAPSKALPEGVLCVPVEKMERLQ